MFGTIFTFELKYWLKRPSTYIYFVAFMGFAFLAFAGASGAFDPPASSTRPDDFVNSPLAINVILQYFNKMLLFLLPAVIGTTLYKDYKGNTHSLLYSYPIRKMEYLLAKLAGAYVVVIFISLSVLVGMIIAEHLPSVHAHKIGEFSVAGYLQAYLLYTLPNLLFYGMVVFAAVAWSRSVYVGFAIPILLIFLQIITENAFAGNSELIAIFDPFAQNTTAYVTRFWTIHEQNTLMVPATGLIIYNRLVWFGITGLIFGFTAYKFSFSQHGMLQFAKGILGKKRAKSETVIAQLGDFNLNETNYQFTLIGDLKRTWKMSLFNLRKMLKNWLFVTIALLGVLAVVFVLTKITSTGEMTLLPTTSIILSLPTSFYTGISILITFVFTGMIVNREETAGIDQLIDSNPVPNWMFFISKFLSIVKMQGVLLLVLMLAGITFQLLSGYYELEIGAYLFHLFVLNYLVLIIWALASLFVHTIIGNMYVAIFVLVTGWIGIGMLPNAGIKSLLVLFNMPPELSYSAVDGYGYALQGYFLAEAYWLSFVAALSVLTFLFWKRGKRFSLREKLMQGRQRLTRTVALLMAVFVLATVISGFSLHKEQSKKSAPTSGQQAKAYNAMLEEFGQYNNLVQPKIVSVDVVLDIFPSTHSFEGKGSYVLVNTTDQRIDTLLVSTGFDEISTYEINQSYDVIASDTVMHISALR